MPGSQLYHPGLCNEGEGELGKKLAQITPKGLTKSLFTVGGAEAIENAIKLADYIPAGIRSLRVIVLSMVHLMAL